MNGKEQGRTLQLYIGLSLVIVPASARPVSFFDTYQIHSPFKTVLDDTACAWAYAQDIHQKSAVLREGDYQVCMYTLMGMVTCLHAAVSVMPIHDIADDEKSYYIRVMRCFEVDCYALRLTEVQRAIIQELFAAMHAILTQAHNAKLGSRQYQSSYTYWQYPKKAIDRLQYRVC